MSAAVEFIPCSEPALAAAAERILDHYQDGLPDLTACQVLLPDLQSAPALRRTLLLAAEKRGYPALLGPEIQTLDSWLRERVALQETVLSQAAQELVLVEAIREAQHLFRDEPWLLSGELLPLFAELTLAHVPLLDLENFTEQLRQGYGLTSEQPTPFTDEARIVFTLWKAWQQQLASDNLLDPASAELKRLSLSLDTVTADEAVWLIGFTNLPTPHRDWLRQLLADNRAHLILHGSAGATGYHPAACLTEIAKQLDTPLPAEDAGQTAFSQFIDALFETATDNLQHRAQQFASRYPQDPLDNRLHLLATRSAEQEARAVQLQVRLWLQQGMTDIGIITEDRRLARRIRALLDRAGIRLQDTGGWALSTTSAAAVLERWLETVEEDFAQAPLLDVLKSPFICSQTDRAWHTQTVCRFEQDIVIHENISRGLARYRRQLARRAERLPDWCDKTRHDVEQLLNRLDHAAEPLRPLQTGSHSVAAYTGALQQSLDELTLSERLAEDPAGQRVLEEIHSLHQVATDRDISMNWQEFRGWLGRTLERFTFIPAASSSSVRLMTLAQSALQQFDAVIIAGCSAEQLPGAPAAQAFFNQSVRRELGLNTWRQSLQLKLHQFCRALEAAPQILLSYCQEQNGEPVAAAPWLELIDVFHHNAYTTSLQDDTLIQWLQSDDQQAAVITVERPASRPAPALPAARIPKDWTASSQQRLIDCPYRFFAADGLGLSAQEEIKQALEKADYGEYVHRILQAFHGGVDHLPGPWRQTLSASTLPQASRLLHEISEAVFANAVEENLLARGWLKRWLAYIPRYLDWQKQRQSRWQVRAVEQKRQHERASGITLKGRIDRVDVGDGELAIIDYKTGATPRQQAVESGEAVQLPSYALLYDEPVSRVEYLQFDQQDVIDKVHLASEELQDLAHATGERLDRLYASLHDAAALPAWGDADVCRYCEFDGLCRRECWIHNDE